MDPRLKRRVQRYGWDKAASSYETFWRAQLRPAQDLLLEMANLQTGQNILDVACGTGLISFEALSRVGMKGQVTGTDLSENMIGQARSEAMRRGSSPIRFEQMDAEALTFKDHSFDTALCALGLMYMPDPRKALEEMERMVKPGGRVVAAVWGARNACGWAALFGIVDRHVASEVCPTFFNLGNPDMLKLTMEAAGLKQIDIRRISTILVYKDASEALGAAFDGGPVALAYHKFNGDIRQEVHRAYLDSLADYKKGEGYEVPGEFVVGRGVCR